MSNPFARPDFPRLVITVLALALASLMLSVPSGAASAAVGGKVAFARNNGSIWVMDPDGSNQTMVYSAGEDPDWSPDATKLAFASGRDIYTMNANGTSVVQLTSTPDEEQTPHWSSDGTKIVFFRSDDIFVMNADGTGVQQLTTDPARDFSPAWSPDGTKVYFTTARGGSYDIYVMNADGTNQVPVITGPDDDFQPAVSPSGDIAYCKNQGASADIWTVNHGQLTTAAGEDCQPDWAPDGSQIVFNSFRAGSSQVWVTNSDGSNQHALTNSGSYDDDPDWSPALSSGAVGGFVDVTTTSGREGVSLVLALAGLGFACVLAGLGARRLGRKRAS
jgi:Tol biopolymer transport system component